MDRHLSKISSELTSSLKKIRFYRLSFSAIVFVAACSTTPSSNTTTYIPGGFPKDARINNALGIRLTRAGLTSLEQVIPSLIQRSLASTIPSGILTSEIPKSESPVPIFGGTITTCVNGPKPNENPPKCITEVKISDFKNVRLQAVDPNVLRFSASIPVRLRNLPLRYKTIIPIDFTVALGVGAANQCAMNDFVALPFSIDIAFDEIPNDALHKARAGYTKLNFKKIDFDTQAIADNFKFCGSGLGVDLLNWLKGFLASSFVEPIKQQVLPVLQQSTCLKSKQADGTNQCPSGTFNVNGTCRFGAKEQDECVPITLGSEMRLDLSSLLSSLSPGTSGGLDLLFAAHSQGAALGENGPTNLGLTLRFAGGALPITQTQCVPKIQSPLPTIPQLPDDLFRNRPVSWPSTMPDPHIGIGTSLAFMNALTTSVYNSGLLCIGVSSETVPSLHAGTLAFILPSIEQIIDRFGLAIKEAPASVIMKMRPQRPPEIDAVEINSSPISPQLQFKLLDTEMDFYIWSHDRMVRIFTTRIDLITKLALEAGAQGIRIKFPSQDAIAFSNAKVVYNSGLLLESESRIMKFINGINELIPTAMFANIPPINLDDFVKSLGLKISIPKEGIRLSKQGNDKFLSMFLNLQTSTSSMPKTRTSIRQTKVKLDRSNFTLDKFSQSPPFIELEAQSSAELENKTIEYAYRVDQSPWTTFFPENRFQVFSPYLNFQGKHLIQVMSRIANQAESESEPVSVPVTIDWEAPMIKIKSVESSNATFWVADLIASSQEIHVETRFDENEWTTLFANGQNSVEYSVNIPANAQQLEIRATDANGNSATTRHSIQQENWGTATPSGCTLNDKYVGSLHSNRWSVFAIASLIGAFFLRKRRFE